MSEPREESWGDHAETWDDAEGVRRYAELAFAALVEIEAGVGLRRDPQGGGTSAFDTGSPDADTWGDSEKTTGRDS